MACRRMTQLYHQMIIQKPKRPSACTYFFCACAIVITVYADGSELFLTDNSTHKWEIPQLSLLDTLIFPTSNIMLQTSLHLSRTNLLPVYECGDSFHHPPSRTIVRWLRWEFTNPTSRVTRAEDFRVNIPVTYVGQVTPLRVIVSSYLLTQTYNITLLHSIHIYKLFFSAMRARNMGNGS